MTTFNITEFYADYIEALNTRNFDKMNEFVADEVTLNGQPGTRDAVVADQKSIVEAVPDFHWNVQELLVDGNRAGARLVNTGTPTKTWHGVEPTGASFENVEYAIYEIRDGKFVDMTFIHDSADAERQLRATA
jgi:predicted ester cyclase